jgi:hypothetical protein
MKTQTRYKLTVLTAIFLAFVTLLAIIYHLETVATTSIAGIMTTLSAYIWSQTTRPSAHEYAKYNFKQDLDSSSSPDTMRTSDLDAK